MVGILSEMKKLPEKLALPEGLELRTYTEAELAEMLDGLLPGDSGPVEEDGFVADPDSSVSPKLQRLFARQEALFGGLEVKALLRLYVEKVLVKLDGSRFRELASAESSSYGSPLAREAFVDAGLDYDEMLSWVGKLQPLALVRDECDRELGRVFEEYVVSRDMLPSESVRRMDLVKAKYRKTSREMPWGEYWESWSKKMNCPDREHENRHREDFLAVWAQMGGSLGARPTFSIFINWCLVVENDQKGFNYFPSILMNNYLEVVRNSRSLDLEYMRLFYARMAKMKDLSESDKQQLARFMPLLDQAKA